MATMSASNFSSCVTVFHDAVLNCRSNLLGVSAADVLAACAVGAGGCGHGCAAFAAFAACVAVRSGAGAARDPEDDAARPLLPRSLSDPDPAKSAFPSRADTLSLRPISMCKRKAEKGCNER